MSSIPPPSRPFSESTPAPWRPALALLLAVLSWPAAWLGMYRCRSAPLAFLLYHSLCFAGGWLLRSSGLPPTERIRRLRREHLLGTVLAANTFAFLLYTLVGAALLDRPRVLGLLDARGLAPSTYLWLFPYFALVNPLAEEFFWRGGVYATLRRLSLSPVAPALISAALFASWHWLIFRLFVAPAWALAGTATVLLVGLALTAVYEQTRRLAYAVILHALAGDAPLLLLLMLLHRE
jgi:membrane protease YdiL (CAAX protease family)